MLNLASENHVRFIQSFTFELALNFFANCKIRSSFLCSDAPITQSLSFLNGAFGLRSHHFEFCALQEKIKMRLCAHSYLSFCRNSRIRYLATPASPGFLFWPCVGRLNPESHNISGLACQTSSGSIRA